MFDDLCVRKAFDQKMVELNADELALGHALASLVYYLDPSANLAAIELVL
jgi:hypothetical protein